MRNLRILAAAGLAGLVLVAAGCGGDDEPSIDEILNDLQTTTTTGATATLGKQEVIAQGDAVCAEANAAIASITVGADRALAAEQVGSITDGIRRELRSLDAPSQGRGDLQDLIAALGDQVTALERRASTSNAGDEAGYEAAGVELANARAAAQAAGDAYGFQSCGQPFDAVPPDTGSDDGGIAPDTPTTSPTTPTSPPSQGGGTGAPDGGTGGGGGGGGGGGSGSSGGVSPG
jgi:hypothetical protein